MYVKSIRPSAKREVQKERSAKRDDQITHPRRAQTCELRAKRADFSNLVFARKFPSPFLLPRFFYSAFILNSSIWMWKTSHQSF